MKQSFILLTIWLCSGMFFYAVNAQSVLTDRLPLSDAIAFSTATNDDKKIAILKSYDRGEGIAELRKNPFLNEIIPSSIDSNYDAYKDDPSESAADAQGGAGSAISDPSIVADALSTFIAARFREELTISFLYSFREKLRVDSTLIYSFPNTRTFMLTGDPFNYKVFVASLRGALDEDIKEFSGNLPNLLKHIEPQLKLDENEKKIFNLFIDLYEPSLNIIKSPSHTYKNIQALVSQLKELNGFNEDIQLVLQMVEIVIKELGNSSYTDWANSNAFDKLGKIKITKAFIGFLLEKYKGHLKSELKDLLFNVNTEQMAKTRVFVQEVVSQSTAILEEINALKARARSKQLSFADYEPLLLSTFSTFKKIVDDDLFAIIGKEMPASFETTLDRMETSVHFLIKLQADISERDYGKVVVNSLNFIKEFIPQEKLDKSTAIKEFVKYADFAINMAGAESAEAMVKALENAALPAQSWRLKRNSFWSVSINSYAGPFLAREHLFDNNTNRAWLTGFTAPIGVTLNWGLTKNNQGKFSPYPSKLIIYNDITTDTLLCYEKKRYFTGHSLSFHVPLIDLGAIVALRLTNEDQPVTDIEWKNLLAPGGYLVWGIGNTPISLGVGVQYGPELRSINDNGNIISSSAFRVGGFIAADIPFFYGYTKTEKVKENKLMKYEMEKKLKKQEKKEKEILKKQEKQKNK